MELNSFWAFLGLTTAKSPMAGEYHQILLVTDSPSQVKSYFLEPPQKE